MASQAIGSYAFLIGVALAIVLGIVGAVMPSLIAGMTGVLTLILVILGLIVGFLNIHDKHISDFLIATIAIVTVGGAAAGLLALDQWIKPVGSVLALVVANIVALAAPAALVVGLKQLVALAKEQQ